MKRPAGVGVTLGLCAHLAGCHETPSLVPCDASPRELVVEVSTWWTRAGEQRAVKDLLDEHNRQEQEHGRSTYVVHSTMETKTLARAMLAARKDRRSVPHAFQANIGTDANWWVTPTVLVQELDSWIDPGWLKSFDATVIGEAQFPKGSGHLYCLPLNVHRTNTLFYNEQTLRDYEINAEELATLGGFKNACAKLKNPPPQLQKPSIVPIVLGTKNAAWTLSTLVHEALLPAIGTARYYFEFWTGKKEIYPDEVLKNTYEEFLSWWKDKLINEDYNRITWDQAVKRLRHDSSPKAAFYIMGDWAAAELADPSGVLPPEIRRRAFPTGVPVDDSSRPFVYTADCFSSPLDAPEVSNSRNLLRTFASAAGQRAFNMAKGSIPVRVDVPVDDWNEMQAKTAKEFRNTDAAYKVLAVSGLVPIDRLKGVDDAVLDVLKEASIEPIIRYWAHHYAELKYE